MLSTIRERLRGAHPYHSTIAQGIAWVALFVFLGKIAGAAKEMAIAWRYGISTEVDAYLFVFNLVSWPLSVWFSVLAIVLIPLAERIRSDAAKELPRFRAELLGFTILLGMGFVLFAWLGLPLLLQSPWTGLPLETVTIATHMTAVLGLLIPMGFLIGLFSAWMLAAGRHANTLLESVPAIVILVALLVFPDGEAKPLVWGTVVGFAFHLVSLAFSLSEKGEIEAPRFSRLSHHWSPFWQGFGIMLTGQMLMSCITIIDQFFAAHMGKGSIATLSYANRILSLIIGLGATAVSRATLPVFSRAQAISGGEVHRVATQWMRILFVLGIIAVIIGWWLAPVAVKLLFERGAFTAQNTEVVTEVLCYGLVQLPFYFAGLVLVSLLASQGKHKLIAINAAVNLLVKVAVSFAIVPLMGINGIITATVIMYIISFALLYSFVNVITNQADRPKCGC